MPSTEVVAHERWAAAAIARVPVQVVNNSLNMLERADKGLMPCPPRSEAQSWEADPGRPAPPVRTGAARVQETQSQQAGMAPQHETRSNEKASTGEQYRHYTQVDKLAALGGERRAAGGGGGAHQASPPWRGCGAPCAFSCAFH